MKIISSRTWGLIAGALAAAAYGLNPLFALPLYKEGMSVDMVLFYRYFLAMVMLGTVLLCRKSSFKLSVRELIWTIIGGQMMVVSSLTLFLAYQHMDAGLASTILFVYPVVVAAAMSLFFGEKSSWKTFCSILLSMIGLMLISCGGGGSRVTTAGVILSLLSAFAYGAYIVSVRKSPLSSIPSDKLTFYVLLFGVPAFLFRLDFPGDVLLPDSVLAWSCVFGSAFFPTIIAFVFMAIGIARVGATPVAILGVLEPVTALLVGVLVFDEVLSLVSAFGILLIMAAVLLIIWAERKISPQ